MSERPGPYRPRAAPTGLRGLVVCRWDATMSGPITMVPDGCVEIMWLEGRGPLVCGPETSSWSANHVRPLEASGVRLRPGIGRHLLGVPMSQLRDQRLSLDELLGRIDTDRVVERLDRAAPTERSSALLCLVTELLATAATRTPNTRVLTEFARSEGVSDLADRLGVTTRQLHRRCQDAFGYGPATLRRILRVQRFLALHKAHPGRPIGQLATDAGFADHSHLVRDCRTLAGVTPSELTLSPQGDWHGDGELIDVRSVQDRRTTPALA